jgi:MinD superfamily P-loop ATPase
MFHGTLRWAGEFNMKEVVIISGKGGTGKTSMVASFAVLSQNAVLADCDVDAADLHLVLSPRIEQRHEFRSGHEAVIREEKCSGCGECVSHCRFEALRLEGPRDGQVTARVDPAACEGCGVCVWVCPEEAIDFPERVCGQWFVSETRWGPLVHARLGIGAENSGKLVTTVRQEARRLAETQSKSLVLIDGPPGIGCPVIASITGTTAVLVITEPTLSGKHDLERVLALTGHFSIPTWVSVNKWDINPDITETVEHAARELNAAVAGRVRYDPGVTRAQVQGRAAVELGGPAADDITAIWKQLNGFAV